uniref:Uncharacterized protein n=1 Tax=Schizaphis graminum TaxID=13262 RepID=A0A2S2ND58_SCHGA
MTRARGNVFIVCARKRYSVLCCLTVPQRLPNHNEQTEVHVYIYIYIYTCTSVCSLWLGNLCGTVKQHNTEYRLRAQTINTFPRARVILVIIILLLLKLNARVSYE